MAPQKDLTSLLSLVQTTQTLLTHFQHSLAPTRPSSGPIPSSTTTTTSTTTTITANDLPTGPLPALKAATTLLKSHTTTLSLLLLTPPLTPSALIAKIGDVTSGPLTGMVAAASYTALPGARDDVGRIMRGEMRAQVSRVIGAWGDVLAVVLSMGQARKEGLGKGKDAGPSESERKEVLERTGLVWDVCDRVIRLCEGGVVELVCGKAQMLRGVLMDALEEMKEWGEDVADEDEEDEGVGSDGEEDEDDFFGAENRLGKNDTELKELLDRSVKKLKMVGIMYQAVGKRRLKTFPVAASVVATKGEAPTTNSEASSPTNEPPTLRLDHLMQTLQAIPDSVDDLASTFYSLSLSDATAGLQKVCDEARSAVQLAEKSWTGADDEFTAWSRRWVEVFDAA